MRCRDSLLSFEDSLTRIHRKDWPYLQRKAIEDALCDLASACFMASDPSQCLEVLEVCNRSITKVDAPF